MLYQDTAEEVPTLNQTRDLSLPSKPNLWRHEWGQMQTLQATRDYFTHCCIFGVCYLKIVSQRRHVSGCRSLRVLQRETTRESWPLLLGFTSTVYNNGFSVCWSSGWTYIYGNSSPRFSFYFFFFSLCTQDQQYAHMWSWKRFDKG